MLGSSRVVAQLAAPQEGLSSMSEWVSEANKFWGMGNIQEINQRKLPSIDYGRHDGLLLLPIRNILVQISAWRPGFLSDVIRCFPQFLQVNARKITQIRLRPLPSMFFPIQYSLIMRT
jgi:hypothetical protein